MLEKQERAANGEVDDEDEGAPSADTPGVASSSAKTEVRFCSLVMVTTKRCVKLGR